jgi:hypothetical protein
MKKTILLVCLWGCTLISQAQRSGSVGGFLLDADTHSGLSRATVILLHGQDSVLVAFTWTNTLGTFHFDHLAFGQYILLITYPDYADFTSKIELHADSPSVNLDQVNMTLKSQLLEEAIVRGSKSIIKIKGDTTEYNTSTIKLEKNAKVEDLLRQLPGIEVDKDGNITAQGKRVEKVLLDGAEFFGDDPTLLTQNIHADMVAKVQLYDAKSDQAVITGIDDNRKTKTINIQLKDDKKTGLFGKVDIGGGTDQYYQSQGMINYFKDNKRLSAFGNWGNTGKVGLGWQEANKYGSSSNNVQFGDAGNVFVLGIANDELETFTGDYSGQGSPTAKTAGLHYDSKSRDKSEANNFNYKIGSLDISGSKEVLTQQDLPTTLFKSVSSQVYDHTISRQKMDESFTKQLDSTSYLKFTFSGTYKQINTLDSFETSNTEGSNDLLNTNKRQLADNKNQLIINANIYYSKNLKKPGESISLVLTQIDNNSLTNGQLRSVINFYGPGSAIDSIDAINQLKRNKVNNSLWGGSASYARSLTKKLSIVAGYSFQTSQSASDKRTFDQDPAGKYTVLDSLYSNYFSLHQISNQGSLFFSYKSRKSSLYFGSKVGAVTFNETNEVSGSHFNKYFVSWNAQTTYQYSLSQQTTLGFVYYGQTKFPTVDQLQPIPINIDPLNVTIGNPNLNQSFVNDFSLTLNSFNPNKGQLIWINAEYSVTSNPIIFITSTDSAGKSTLESQNLTTVHPIDVHLYSVFNRKIRLWDCTAGVKLNGSGNIIYSVVNESVNRIQSYLFSGELTLSKSKINHYGINLSGGPIYTIGESSLQPSINNNGIGLTSSGSIFFYIWKDLLIGSDANYQYRARTRSFDTDFHRMVINSTVSKLFGKNHDLKVSFSVRDLLNQNSGFDRTAAANLIVQNNYSTIKRYVLLSASWDFTKMTRTKS